MQGSEWKCSICGKVLSRKFRLVSHMQSIHNVSMDDVRKYKLYTVDQNVTIPRTTQYRHRIKGCQSGTSDGSSLAEHALPGSSCDSSYYQPTSSSDIPSPLQCLTPVMCCIDSTENSAENSHVDGIPYHNCIDLAIAQNIDNTIDSVDIDSNDYTACSQDATYDNTCNASISDCEKTTDLTDSETSSDFSSESDSDYTFLSSDVQSDSDTDFETPENTNNQISDYDQKCLVLLSALMKHHLSGQASEDILQAFNVISMGAGQTNKMSLSQLKETIGACDVEVVDFCSICYTLFPKDDTVILCTLHNCPGLRFKGPPTEQHRQQRQCYFACLSLESQLKDILEREGVWLALEQYRIKCVNSTSISDILNGEIYNSLCQPGQFLSTKENLSLLFNTDGFPIYKSSSVSIWPVYLVINELPPAMRFSKRNVILWGVWQAQDKPVFRTFFQPFVEQMVRLKQDGVLLRICDAVVQCRLILIAGTLDLQAKAMMVDMTHHNGQFGCLTCEEPGKVVAQGRGHCRVYPFTREPAPTRSSTGVLDCAIEATPRRSVLGIKGVSCLFAMDWFDIVYGLVPDYMHSTLLGLTKKMMTLLFTTSYARQPYSVGAEIKKIDKRLMNMKPTDGVTRLPRKLEKNIHHLKATEFQIWLLFYALPCLMGIMDPKYLDHLALLVEGVYILLGDEISMEKLNRAEVVLQTFYRQFTTLYGENHCTLNLHNVCQHLVVYVRKLGPLWAWSCFPFEDMNGNLLNYVHGTGDVCQQILWRVQAEKRLAVDVGRMSLPHLKTFVQKMIRVGRHVKAKIICENCKIAGGMAKISLDMYMESQLKDCLCLSPDEHVGNIFKVSRVIINESVYYSENYTRLTKRFGHIVLTNGSGDINMALVKYYLYHENSNRCVAVVDRLDINTSRPLLHPCVNHLIHVTMHAGTYGVIIPVDSFKEKLMYLTGNRDYCCVARLPNLYNQCC